MRRREHVALPVAGNCARARELREAALVGGRSGPIGPEHLPRVSATKYPRRGADVDVEELDLDGFERRQHSSRCCARRGAIAQKPREKKLRE